MSGGQEVTYGLDFGAGSRERHSAGRQPPNRIISDCAIPRIARLMALAIRFEGLVRQGAFRDYAEIARLGRVTRARMTQIMKLVDLAPDIQEQILFLPTGRNLNERKLRCVVSTIDWCEQRRLFDRITGGLADSA